MYLPPYNYGHYIVSVFRECLYLGRECPYLGRALPYLWNEYPNMVLNNEIFPEMLFVNKTSLWSVLYRDATLES